ncbi:MAG: DNA-processing protein DprA [Bacteroidia bacterium]
MELGDELFYTMALTQVKGVGAEGARTLITSIGTAKDVFTAPQRELLALPGLGQKTIANILAFKNFKRVEDEIKFIDNHKIKVFSFADPEYPERLKQLSNAPAIVFYKGTVSLNHARIIGVVGTRKATDYGKQMVENLMSELKEYNVITVSGLAYGIDIECHKKSLVNNIPSIGVMASGLDVVYPTAHTNTAREMLKNGGLMTEQLSKTVMKKEFFPRRNRLVAGLVDALVVAESAKSGGSLITAEIANSYSRDVYAYPGKATDDKSSGCNMLIKRQKAMLIENAADLAWHLGWPSPNAQSSQNQKSSQLKGIEKRIYIYLLNEPNQKCHSDKMCFDLDINQTELSLLLLNMEFSGYVKTLPGNNYKAI